MEPLSVLHITEFGLPLQYESPSFEEYNTIFHPAAEPTHVHKDTLLTTSTMVISQEEITDEWTGCQTDRTGDKMR